MDLSRNELLDQPEHYPGYQPGPTPEGVPYAFPSNAPLVHTNNSQEERAYPPLQNELVDQPQYYPGSQSGPTSEDVPYAFPPNAPPVHTDNLQEGQAYPPLQNELVDQPQYYPGSQSGPTPEDVPYAFSPNAPPVYSDKSRAGQAYPPLQNELVDQPPYYTGSQLGPTPQDVPYAFPPNVPRVPPYQPPPGAYRTPWAVPGPAQMTFIAPVHRNPRLFHPSGVPSFEGFTSEVQPGCYNQGLRAQRVAMILHSVQSDHSFTPENRQLAVDMINHFSAYGNTYCRNCVLGWGIYLVVNAIYGLATDSSLLLGTIVVLIIGLICFLSWCVPFCRERKSAVILQQREAEALSHAVAPNEYIS